MKRIVLLILKGYKKFISPLLPPSCRFVPTCSEYAMEAVRRYGVFRGGFLALRRILRCNPFCKAGYDPVPDLKPIFVKKKKQDINERK